MDSRALKADLLLLLTAAIWGFAFVAQRVGMDHVGPFTYNALRFAIGSLSLVPLIIVANRKNKQKELPVGDARSILVGGVMAGLVLFAGASLQQAGLVYTTAGNAGFITGLYVVIVPLLGLFWKQYPGPGVWIGALLSATGLYFLSITESLTISFGDLLVLLSAFFWAGHVLLIGWLSPKMDSLKLASAQFAICSLFSLLVAFGFETMTVSGIISATIPILYGGLFSVGIAYTLQVVAQRHAHPAHSAILLSLEGVFAAIGGWLLLAEVLSLRSLLGCALMLSGMLFSELSGYLFGHRKARLEKSIID